MGKGVGMGMGKGEGPHPRCHPPARARSLARAPAQPHARGPRRDVDDGEGGGVNRTSCATAPSTA